MADCPIHTDDLGLVRDQDKEWLRSLTVADVKRLIGQDDIARMALYLKRKNSGLSAEQAAAVVRKHFPDFYFVVEQRDWEGKLDGDDVQLPFCVKDRINRGVRNIQKSEIQSATSMNTLIRRMIREGRM